MKTMKSMHIALFGALLLVAGSVSVWAQAPQQTRDQSQSDSSTPNKSKKTKKTNADGSNSQGPPRRGQPRLRQLPRPRPPANLLRPQQLQQAR